MAAVPYPGSGNVCEAQGSAGEHRKAGTFKKLKSLNALQLWLFRVPSFYLSNEVVLL